MTQQLDRLKQNYQFQRQYTHKTPLIYSPGLTRLIDGQVLIKAESMQKTGAFKFRGALSRLQAMSSSDKTKGVIAYSSGNFARGLAAAGKVLGIKTHIVMPADAPSNKINNARSEGADVILSKNKSPSREEAASTMATEIAAQYGYVLLHPFDDPLIIEGQAALALELMEQLPECELECLLCPTGGGSLSCGSSLALTLAGFGTDIYAIEPEGYDGMQQSLRHNHLSRAIGNTQSSCDALQARSPGVHNFHIAQHSPLKTLAVSEATVIQAMKLAFTELKLVLEPSGAIGIGAVLQNPELFQGRNIVVIATGGNVDSELYCQLLRSDDLNNQYGQRPLIKASGQVDPATS